MIELARGGSHIASTLTDAGELAAIIDVTGEFYRRYGEDDFDLFLELLAEALESRIRPDAARLVRGHKANAIGQFRKGTLEHASRDGLPVSSPIRHRRQI